MMVSLLLLASGGDAWTLTTNGAGPFPVPTEAALPEGAEWAPTVGADGHHGYANLGVVTPSPPLAVPPTLGP